MGKYFIITVDTEGDNLWNWREGMPVETENTLYIERFQKLCDQFNFKPVYLTNYEMLCDDRYVAMVKQWHNEGRCEVALHLHAWNNPPMYDLKGSHSGNPYLIEYPYVVMRAKFENLFNLFVSKMGFKPVSHRAGRWAMDSRYFMLLKEFDIKVDCSYTPGIDWSKSIGRTMAGPNYSKIKNGATMVDGVLEVPMTIMKVHAFIGSNLLSKIKGKVCGRGLQLRPAICDILSMKKVVDYFNHEDQVNYLEFMIHSAELMPGGSPYFEDEKSIDNEFEMMKEIFAYAKSKSYHGITLAEYERSGKYE